MQIGSKSVLNLIAILISDSFQVQFVYTRIALQNTTTFLNHKPLHWKYWNVKCVLAEKKYTTAINETFLTYFILRKIINEKD